MRDNLWQADWGPRFQEIKALRKSKPYDYQCLTVVAKVMKTLGLWEEHGERVVAMALGEPNRTKSIDKSSS